jgi:drug/metabolite transporter (DMT)-like permease
LAAFFAIVTAATLWGLSGTVAKYLFIHAVPPFILVEIRMGLAALVLLATLAVFRPTLLRISWRDLPYLMILGGIGMAGVQFTYLFTISQTNVGTAIFLQYLAPILVFSYAALFQRARIPGLGWLSLAVAMAGSFFLIFGEPGLRLAVSPLGLTTGVLSACFFAFYTLYGKHGVKRLSPWTILTYALAFGALFWSVIAPPWKVLSLAWYHPQWPLFFFIAIFATVLPFGLYLWGLQQLHAAVATVTAILEPLVGTVSAFLILSEVMTPLQIMGGIGILIAVTILQLAPEIT